MTLVAVRRQERAERTKVLFFSKPAAIDARSEVFLIVEELLKKLYGEGKELLLPSSRCLMVFVYMLSVA